MDTPGFQEALRRIEAGLATAEDARIIREYVADLEENMRHFQDRLGEAHEMLLRERESGNRLQRSLDEALNAGSGVYIP